MSSSPLESNGGSRGGDSDEEIESATALIDKATTLIRREGGLSLFIRNVGFGGVFYAMIVQIITIIRGSGLVIFGPIRALGRGTILLIDVTFGGLGEVFGAGTEATVRSFSTGLAQYLGILAQPVSVGVAMLSLFIFIRLINRIGISPLSIITNGIRG